MAQAARVSSIDALKEFRRALESFAQLAFVALGEAQADVRRTIDWIEHEQLSYWQGQKKKRTAKLALAKSELFRAELASEDARARPTTERRAYEKAKAALEESETKLANIKRWSRVLEREQLLYKGECQQLGRAVEGDLPQALGRLDKMVAALEKYVKLHAPAPLDAAAPAEPDAEPEPGGQEPARKAGP